MLFSYCVLVFCNAYAFCMISTIPKKAGDYYGQSQLFILFLIQIFFVVYILTAPFAACIIRKSVHRSMLICLIFTSLGAWIKYLAGPIYYIAIVGVFCIAVVTSILLTLLSAVV